MSRTLIAILLPLVFASICLPLSLSKHAGNFDQDEVAFYAKEIHSIRPHWPIVHLLADSASATSPGYSYALAGLSLVTGERIILFRMVTALASGALLAALVLQFGHGDEQLGFLAIVPLAASNFFIKSASWVVTDNAALLCAVACLISLRWRVARKCDSPSPGIWGTCAIFCRQLHAWLLAPLFLFTLYLMTGAENERRRLPWKAAIGLVLPVGLLAWLYLSWGGPVPPEWTITRAKGFYFFASPACALTVFAPFGAFYLTTVEPPKAILARCRTSWAFGGALTGLVCALAAPNTYNTAQSRWGGYFWALVAATPAVGTRSLVIVAGSTLGGLLLAAMCRRLFLHNRVQGILWSGSVVAWLVATGINRLAFQRYFEPPIICFLVLWLCLGRIPNEPFRRWPLAFLAAAQLAVSIATTFLPVLR